MSSWPCGIRRELGSEDVAEHRGVAMVVIAGNLLPPDPAVVVIPLLTGYPAVKHLNPEIAMDGQRWVLATRLVTSVRRAYLRRIGHVGDQGHLITRAMDALMAGV